MMTSDKKDDAATVAAIAVIAACIATAVHFTVGHGGACLAIGGHPTLLTTVQFECSISTNLIALGGPLASFAAGLTAWLLLKAMGEAQVLVRQFLVLAMAINLYWVAGSLLYSALINGHDWYWILYPIQGPPGPLLRVGEAIAAAAIYLLTTSEMQRHAVSVAGDASRARNRLALSWLAASAAVCSAAFLYAPHRLANVWGAAWEVGGWSLPLLAPMLRSQSLAVGPYAMITQQPKLVAIAALALGILAATMGKGLP